MSFPQTNRSYASLEYWEDRFSTEESYDWLLNYQQLAPQLQHYIPGPSSRILVVGCGNSPFSADLYRAGYQNVVNVDYAKTVISKMKQQHANLVGMSWHVADVTKLEDWQFLVDQDQQDTKFDVVIDKAVMDAIMADEGDVWYPKVIVVQQAHSMLQVISGLLKKDCGIFLQISLTQPHFRKKYLLGNWQVNRDNQVEDNKDASDDKYSHMFQWTYHEETAGSRDPMNGSFGHYLYIMKMQKNGFHN